MKTENEVATFIFCFHLFPNRSAGDTRMMMLFTGYCPTSSVKAVIPSRKNNPLQASI